MQAACLGTNSIIHTYRLLVQKDIPLFPYTYHQHSPTQARLLVSYTTDSTLPSWACKKGSMATSPTERPTSPTSKKPIVANRYAILIPYFNGSRMRYPCVPYVRTYNLHCHRQYHHHHAVQITPKLPRLTPPPSQQPLPPSH